MIMVDILTQINSQKLCYQCFLLVELFSRIIKAIHNDSYYLYGLGGRMLVSVLSKIFFSLLRPPTVLAFAFLLTFSRHITCSTSTARSGME